MKLRLNLFIYFGLILFLISNSFALSINIVGNVNEYSKIYSETVFINLKCSESLNLTLPNSATNVYYLEKPTNIKSFFLHNCNGSNVINYNLNKLEILPNGLVRIERNFKIYSNLNYSYSLSIPFNLELNKNLSTPNIFNQFIRNNKKLITLPKNDIYLIYLNEVATKSSPVNFNHIKKELKEPIVLILMFLSFLFGIFLSYIYFIKYRWENISQVVPSFVLSLEEKQILDVIKRNQGINQKQICIEMGFSKARVSKYVNDLEDKKLIRRERFGRSYKVYIEKQVI